MPLLVHLFIAGASETIENLLVELDIGTIDKILSRLEIFTIIHVDWMSFSQIIMLSTSVILRFLAIGDVVLRL